MRPLFDQKSAQRHGKEWIQAIVVRAEDICLDEELSLLSCEERSKHSSLQLAKHQHEFAVAHVLKRRVLAAYLNLNDPSQLQFDKDQYGKPKLTDSNLHFNLSHSQGLIALAFSIAGPCGIDIEKHRTITFSSSLINATMTRAEKQAIEAADEPFQAFFHRWVIKEALVKAQGVGLNQPLTDICTDAKHFPFWQSDKKVSEQQFWNLTTQDYSLAICSLNAQPHFLVDYPVCA